MMPIDLDTYCACRIALAMAILAEPGNPRHRRAFNALHDALVNENDCAVQADAMPTSMLLRKQAG